MASHLRSLGALILFLAQRSAFVVIILAAIGAVVLTVMSATGFAPWLEFGVTFGETIYPNAGMITQIGLMVLSLMLLFYLPSNARIMSLETSHRSFSIGMSDVANAYCAIHAADRANMFQLSSEFDSVRERLAYLRDHPDLSDLEPSLLEVAAQMSHISKELATVYSDEKVTRARDFLTQRQQEVARFNERLIWAKETSLELKRWHHEVELEESVAASQLVRLRENLMEILPELGMEKTYGDGDYDETRVTAIGRKAAE